MKPVVDPKKAEKKMENFMFGVAFVLFRSPVCFVYLGFCDRKQKASSSYRASQACPFFALTSSHNTLSRFCLSLSSSSNIYLTEIALVPHFLGVDIVEFFSNGFSPAARNPTCT
jgi:hypothetical protein